MSYMLKIRNSLLIAGCIFSTILFQGCSALGNGMNNSDSGQVFRLGSKEKNEAENSDGYDLIDKSMYLDTDLLKKDTKTTSSYSTYEVTRGEFITNYDLLKGELYYPDLRMVNADYEKGTMIFEEYLIEQGQYVKVGDPIAKVHIELDTTELNELNLKLNRYQKRYREDQDKFERNKIEYNRRLKQQTTQAQNLDLRLEYEEFLNQWDNTKENWIATIEDTQEAIATYEDAKSMTELVSEEEGYLIYLSNLREGVEIKNNDVICGILPDSSVYVKVDNSNQMLCYGCPVTVKFGANQIAYEGEVVSADPKTTSYDLYDEFAYILVHCNLEDVYSYRSATISYVAESMKDVLLVEKAAVTVEDDIPYVTVLNEDGTLLKTGFLSGGSNQNYYWVYSGLSEGMKLVKQ